MDGLKDLIHLLSVFKDVPILVQTGSRPSLHMAYIAVNKLEHRLNGNDVNENGESINIDDRHEGDQQILMQQSVKYSFFLLGTEFFRKRVLQLLRTMFTFDEKHLVAAVLHPLYRRLTFGSTYSKTIARSYIRQQVDEILGISNEQQTSISEPSRNINQWRSSLLILMTIVILITFI